MAAFLDRRHVGTREHYFASAVHLEEQRISSRRMGGVDQSKIGGSLEIEADVTGNTLETNKTVTQDDGF